METDPTDNSQANVLFCDVIGSRKAYEPGNPMARYTLYQAMNESVHFVNTKFDTKNEIRIVHGDGIIGELKSVQDSLQAALLLRLYILTKVGFDLRSGIGVGDPNLDLEHPFNFVPDDASFLFAEQSLKHLKDNPEFNTYVSGVSEFEETIGVINLWLDLRDKSLEDLDYFQKLILLHTLSGKNPIEISERIFRPLDQIESAVEGNIFQGIVNTFHESSSI